MSSELNKSGVYKIVNAIDGKIYIGSTRRTFLGRWKKHQSRLRNNKHPNSKLQNAWNKYGKENFQFIVIEKCEPFNAFDREQYYLDKLNPQYNILPFAGTSLGYRHTDDTKKKISDAFQGEKNWNYSGKYVFYHPENKFFVGSRTDLTQKFNLRKSGVDKICGKKLNTHWGWICLGNYPVRIPSDIDSLYHKILHKNTPIQVFYHKKYGMFIGQLKDFIAKFNLKRDSINGLINESRNSILGWIYLGKHVKSFTIPSDISMEYEEKIRRNNLTKRIPQKTATFQHDTGKTFEGRLKDFSNQYKLHLRCVIRLFNGGRKAYRGWSIKN